MSEETEQKTVQPNEKLLNVGKVYRVGNKGTELVIDNGIALKEINRGDWLIYDPATTTPSELLGAIFGE